MENKKLELLIFWVFITTGLFFASQTHAYWNDTHEYLTSESINLYNKSAGDNAIPTDLKQYLYDGVKAEDADPRYVNHFYDPINNAGLNGVINGEASKDWVNDSSAQKGATYSIPAKTSLSSVAYKKTATFYPTSDFTWDTALRYWINGDKEMAMETLGHVLHLIEDLGVPEHTRNDPHADGSEYEKYANKYSLATPDKNFAFRLGDKKQIELGTLDAYFDSLARYSNKYFYSPGSIGISGGYAYPEPDYKTAELKKDGKYYVKNTDDEGQQYYLAAYNSLENIMTPYDWDVSVNKDLVKDSYWNLLSVRTVRTGGGVIDLFFRDVEKAKADPTFLRQVKNVADKPTFFGQLWNGVRDVALNTVSFFGSVFNSFGNGLSSAARFIGGLFANDTGLSDAGSVDLSGSDAGGAAVGSVGGRADSKPAASAKRDTAAKQKDEIAALKLQIAGLKKDAQAQDKAVLQLEKTAAAGLAKPTATVVDATDVVADAQAKQTTPSCVYGSGAISGQRSVIINEVAWMGSARSASDEWIELKNISGGDIDLSGWQLMNKGGGVKIALGALKHPVIRSGDFVLLERTDNNSAVGATADLIYSGALANGNEGLRLFNASCGIADEVAVSARWAAGSNDSKQTMERDANGYGWHTSSSAGGTPKRENSAGVAYSGGGGGGATIVSGSTKQAGIGGDPITPKTYPKLLISEVRLAGASSTHDEFVRLYNPNDVSVDLTGWYVQKKTKSGADYSSFAKADLFTGKQIASHETVTIAHPSSSVPYDIASDYGIADDNTLVIKDPNGDILDKVGWGSSGDCEGACAPNPADSQSIIRKRAQGVVVDTDNNSNDFELSSVQDPVVLTDTATTTATNTEINSTSTVYWDGGVQSGTVYELFTDRWVGQRVHFPNSVDIGRIALGYYNDFGPGSVDVAIFAEDGSRQWGDTVSIPRISYGGLVENALASPLHLESGDYFVGSRLVNGTIGIRRGYGSNPCSVAVYADGPIPVCVDGNDVNMIIGAPVATSTPIVIDPATATTTATTTEQTTQFHPVVINEIMYDLPGADDGREWIELRNNGTTSVDIADWRLSENDTKHLLKIKQGTSTLSVGGYAIIANDSTKFLEDNAGFSGPLFDSAFSLGNEGEPIALKNGGLVIDSVTYASSTGANGDGMSLQRVDGGWYAAPPTPGAQNAILDIAVTDSATTTATTTDLVIATSTATTTEAAPSLLIGQLMHDARSNPSLVTYYVQTIQRGSIGAIKSLELYGEGDRSGMWNAGICRVPEGNPTKCLQNMVALASAQQSVPTAAAKTSLVFGFASPVVLDPAQDYALYVRPATGSNSVIYGAASDAYTGGYLAGFSGIEMVNLGIKDMYFGMQ